MNSPLLSRLRRARWVHGLQLLVFACWVANPFPGALSYWTDSNGDRVKEEVANPPEGDSWFDQDSDGDGLTNAEEVLFGSDPYNIDSDFDGLTDLVERDFSDPTAPYDPWNWDSNGDGYSDHDDFYQRLWGYQPVVNYHQLSPGSFYSYADADGDGEKNPEDSDPLNFDRDWDGTPNWLDGSPMYNGVGGEWMDDSNNGVWTDPGVYIGGNWYPSGTADSDYDGTPDHLDIYPYGSFYYEGMEYEGSWQDSDGDGIPDMADGWPYDSTNGNASPEGYDYNGTWYYGSWQDSDGDGIPDPADAYPYDPANGGFDYNGTWYFGPWVDSDSDGIPDPADSWPYDPLNGAYLEGYDYNGTWYYGSWQDSDGDGIPDPADAWPYDSNNGTWVEPDSDGDGIPDSSDAYPYDATNGANYYYNGSTYSGTWTDSDNDGAPDPQDSHSSDPALWDDFDNDGRNAADDSHPDTSGLWSDWNFDGDNHDTDGDEDGTPDVRDSHPRESWRWADWDGDGSNDPSGQNHDNDSRLNEDDSHPADGTLWSDWNFDGDNNDSDGDEDGHPDTEDSHPHDPALWSDWNFDGTNNDSDGDEDGWLDADDSHPRHAGLHSDWNGDGDDNDADWDEDGVENGQDTSPKNAALWDDQDGDGHNAADDSHPQNPALWSDWNLDGDNHDTDGDEDGWADSLDSHPREALLWNDFDGDGHNADHDSHPADAALWSDWDGNGQNNDADWDEDGYANENDSAPYSAMLWSDWDHNGINNDTDGDEDGTDDGVDSHPRDASLQNDWNFDGENDGPDDDSDGDGRPNGADSDPLNAALWSDWNHDGDNNDADVDEDGVLNDEDSHPFDPALSTDWNFDGDDNAEDMDEDGWANTQFSPEGLPVEGSDSHPRDPLLWSDWDGNGINNDDDWDEDGVLNANDSHPRHAALWSDWDFNQVNNDEDGDEDGVIDSQDSDPRNNALSSDWNHDGTDNPSDWDEDGYDNGTDSHPTDASLWDDFDGDGHNAENDSHPADGSLWSDWNHDGDNHATDGDEDGTPDLSDSHPRNPALWVDWNHDGYNDGDEPPDDDNDGIPNDQDDFPNDPYNNADSDGDGLSDYDEVTTHGTDRFNADSDGDGLLDGAEVSEHQTNPLNVDTDGDGLTDHEELMFYQTNPLAKRTNSGQIYTDYQTVNTDDSDGDGIPDRVEEFYGLDPQAFDSDGDLDGDGVSNIDAYTAGQILDNRDTDGDGLPNPVDEFPNDPYNNADSDGDGIVDKDDPFRLDPENGADGDGDGLSNYDETHEHHTNPEHPDTDGDGLTDYEELLVYHTNPLLPKTNPALPYTDFQAVDQTDSDADGIPNRIELFYALNPADAQDGSGDLDGDGISNLNAYLNGWDLRRYLNVYDQDSDGILDVVEDYWSTVQPGVLSSANFADAVEDADGDGLLNYEEILLGTSPVSAETFEGTADLVFVNTAHSLDWHLPMSVGDTDGDGMSDAWEHRHGAWRFAVGGLKLRSAADVTSDPDGDGLSNLNEFRFHSHPLVRDTNQDGVADSSRLYATNVNQRGLNGLTSRYQAQMAADMAAGTPVSRAFSEYRPPAETSVRPLLKALVTTTVNGKTTQALEDLPTSIRSSTETQVQATGCTCLSATYSHELCSACQGAGQIFPDPSETPQTNTLVCTHCNGVKSVICSPCAGLGSFDCPRCVSGFDGIDPVTGSPAPCAACLGVGVFNCYTCEGSGRERCQDCGGVGYHLDTTTQAPPPGTPQVCANCQGDGIHSIQTGSAEQTPGCPVHDPGMMACPDCGGSGSLTVPDENGDDTQVPCGTCGETGSVTTAPQTETTTTITRQSAEVRLIFPPGSERHYHERHRIFVNGQMHALLSRNQTITFVAEPSMNQSKSITLEPPEEGSATLMANDSAGPRYRKIGLNGMPLSDSKPQVQDESGEIPEETHIDAYTRQLRHSVSDVYASADGSLLPLMLRRDVQPECWNNRSGLRPHERPDTPFGAGWSSNLCSYVRFEKQGWPSSASFKATVGDEMGARQNFYLHGASWVHSKEEVLDAKTAKNTFMASGNGQNFSNIVLTKKFGTTCYYEMLPALHQSIPQDRELGSTEQEESFYARLVEVRDRQGNRLVYSYPSAATLIPSRVEDPDRPGRRMFITQQNGVVTAVRGPDGGTITYAYAPLGGDGALKLESVSRGGTTVSYAYSLAVETDPTPAEPGRSPGRFMHLELSAITDELGRQYRFLRAGFEHGLTYQQVTYTDPFGTGLVFTPSIINRVQTGLPMPVTGVLLPDGQTVALTGGRSIRATLNAPYAEVLSMPWTTVSGPAGTCSYHFSQPVPELAAFSRSNPALGQNALADENPNSTTMVLNFTHMDITSAAGTESFSFNPQAAMALASATDVSGNTTTFSYGADGYDDPTVETDALGNFKNFTYDPSTRVMATMTDQTGVTTTYEIEPGTGLKLAETVTGAGGHIERRSTFEFQHPTFKGVMTRSTVDASDSDTAPPTVTTCELGSGDTGWTEVTQTTQTASGAVSSTTVNDCAGNKRSVIDGRGLITNFEYDASLRLVKVTHPDNAEKHLAYDAHGNLLRETNENGVSTFHEYDLMNRRVKSTVDLNGNGVADNVYTTANSEPGTANVSYNGDITTTTTYNTRGQVATVTDARGKVTAHTYDVAGRLISTNDGGLITTMEYGPNSGGSVFDSSGFKPTQITDPRGAVTTLAYDKMYRTTAQTVSAGGITATTSTQYDPAGRPTRVTDPLGRVTLTVYDVFGQIQRVTHPDGTQVSTDYTHHGKPYKVIDEVGNLTQTEFDAAGRAVKTISPAVNGVSATTQTEYDAAGNAIRVTDALGRVTESQYDERNRPVAVYAPPVWDALGQTFVRPGTQTTYDALGQVISVTDPQGNVTTKHYDRAGRNWLVEAPVIQGAGASSSRPTTLTKFDPGGLALTLTNPLNQTVTNTYDTLGRLITTVDAAGITNTFAYDAAGNRTSVKDGLNQETTFVYDGFNRLTSQTFANGDTTSFVYDAVRKLSQTSPRGITTTYTYDVRDRVIATNAQGGGVSDSLTRTHQYDIAGRLLSVSEPANPAANVSYTYDVLGRVLTETSRGVTHTYSYDIAGNRVRADYGTGRSVQTAYDALNRPESIVEGNRATRYGYDLGGRAVILMAGNGQVTSNSHDALGRLKQRTLYRNQSMGEADVMARFEWEHDLLGNVTSQSETWPGEPTRPGTRTTSMAYDANNRLIGETITDPSAGVTATTYAYDAANNRSSKQVTGGTEPGLWSYVYNAANQLTSWAKSLEGTAVKTATLGYDAAGNRSSQVIQHPGSSIQPQATSYAWDAQDRLSTVTMPDGAIHDYEYDYRTRRIETRSGGILPPFITAILFAGGLSLAEYDASASPSSSIENPASSIVQYVRGPDMGGGVGGMLYSLRGGTTKYSLSNGRGDIVAQADQGANLTWTASYEAYGKRTKETGTNQDKQRANSKDEDPTGLLNEGFRYRDIETGVWLSRDPAGFVDGPNLYAYVKQNPWSAFDAKGLKTEWHHRLPQKYRDKFEAMNIDIDQKDNGILLDDKDHRAIHKKDGFFFGEDRYNKEWGKFFDGLKQEEKLGPLENSAKQQKVFDFLTELESRPEINSLLKKGANVPHGVDYKTYSGWSKEMKGDFYKAAWGAKKAGVSATFVGTVADGAKTAAHVAASASKSGLKFLFQKLPLIGTAAAAFGAATTGYSQGSDAAGNYLMMELSNASLVQDTVGAYTEETIAPAMYGRTFDALSRVDDAINNGASLLPEYDPKPAQ